MEGKDAHLFGLTLQIRVHDCDVVVAADDVAQCGQALFYALDFDFVRKRVAQVLQFLVCGCCGDEETFAVTIEDTLVVVQCMWVATEPPRVVNCRLTRRSDGRQCEFQRWWHGRRG
jgi:hypothetical protein